MRFHHVNVVVPPGATDDVVPFYAEVLGLRRVEKPTEGVAPAGAWFDIDHATQVHVSERPGERNDDAHFGVVVDDLDEVVTRVRAAGAPWTDSTVDPRHPARVHARPGRQQGRAARARRSAVLTAGAAVWNGQHLDDHDDDLVVADVAQPVRPRHLVEPAHLARLALDVVQHVSVGVDDLRADRGHHHRQVRVAVGVRGLLAPRRDAVLPDAYDAVVEQQLFTECFAVV